LVLKIETMIYEISIRAFKSGTSVEILQLHTTSLNFTKSMKVRTMAMSKKDLEKKKSAKREKMEKLEKMASAGSKDAKKKLAKEKKKK